MFDIGFWELAVIGIVALLVVGPEKMPTMIRTAGQWAGQLQRMARDLRRDIEQEAHTEEYRALNSEFLAEDRRLKDLSRNTANAPTPAQTAEPAATESKPETEV
jgi:sec-independent protein translocase protein TatB